MCINFQKFLQLTQQQLVRVVTAQGISHLQGITPTFFAVPNGFPSPAAPVIRTHAPSSPAPREYFFLNNQ